jgi:hypothetical protein
MTTKTTGKQTIILTGRRPIRITEADWPIIAGFINEYEDVASIAVRQHADGRAIVQGHDNHNTGAGGLNWEHLDGEYIQTAADTAAIVSAIESVGHRLHNRSHGDWHEYGEVIAATIADLDPEDIA